MIGLGRMGANMVRRLMKHQHECVVYDRGLDAVKAMEKEGATGTSSLADLVKALASPKVIWLMVPAGEATESTVAALGKILPRGSTIIDGGNSFTKTMFAGTRTSRKRGSIISMSAPAGSLGSRTVLLPDDWRRRRHGEA